MVKNGSKWPYSYEGQKRPQKWPQKRVDLDGFPTPPRETDQNHPFCMGFSSVKIRKLPEVLGVFDDFGYLSSKKREKHCHCSKYIYFVVVFMCAMQWTQVLVDHKTNLAAILYENSSKFGRKWGWLSRVPTTGSIYIQGKPDRKWVFWLSKPSPR